MIRSTALLTSVVVASGRTAARTPWRAATAAAAVSVMPIDSQEVHQCAHRSLHPAAPHTPAKIATPYGTFAEALYAGVDRACTTDDGFVTSWNIHSVLMPKVLVSVGIRCPRTSAETSDSTPPAIATARRN